MEITFEMIWLIFRGLVTNQRKIWLCKRFLNSKTVIKVRLNVTSVILTLKKLALFLEFLSVTTRWTDQRLIITCALLKELASFFLIALWMKFFLKEHSYFLVFTRYLWKESYCKITKIGKKYLVKMRVHENENAPSDYFLTPLWIGLEPLVASF